MRALLAAVVGVASAGFVACGGDHFVAAAGDAAGSDAGAAGLGDAAGASDGSDAGPRCSTSSPFAHPESLASLNPNGTVASSLRFVPGTSVAYAAFGGKLWSTLQLPGGGFASAMYLSSIDAGGDATHATISGDGTRLYFASRRADGTTWRIWYAPRDATSGALSAPVAASVGISPGLSAQDPWLTADGKTLYVLLEQGSKVIAMASSTSDPTTFSSVTPLAGDVNTTGTPGDPVLSSDGNELYYSRTDASGERVFVATRSDVGTFTQSQPLSTDVNATGTSNVPVWISPDDCVLYVVSDRTGDKEVWRFTR